jgi:poly(A) polymerase
VPRFPTGKQVYDRIRWDPWLDSRRFAIGYQTREHGIQEMPFAEFVPDGDIPWHRLRQIRFGDLVVWDRTRRIDRLAELRASLSPPSPAEADDEPPTPRFPEPRRR